MKKLFVITFLMSITINAWGVYCGYNPTINSYYGTLTDQTQSLSQTTTLSRDNNSPSPHCTDYRIYFGKGYANSYQRRAYVGSNSIPYNFYADANLGVVLKDYGDAGTGEYLSGQAITPNTNYSKNYYLGLPTRQSVFSTPPNVYTDVVPVGYYCVKQNGVIEHQTTRYITISINHPRFAELSLVPVGSAHDPSSTVHIMDFGDLTTNEVMEADLRIVANVGYGVMMASAHGSHLSNGSTNIPYQIKVGSNAYTTLWGNGSQNSVAQSNNSSSLAGHVYNVKVKIGNVPANITGSDNFEDVITVTVQAW